MALAGISWGGKTAVITAARHPDLVDSLALICPGLQPRVGVPLKERLRIALAFFTNRRKTFPIPLSNPALFTDNPVGQQFIADDPLGLRQATAGLLAASTFIDRMARKSLRRLEQPVLLILASEDRIVDNARTLRYFERVASRDKQVMTYHGAHHTLEFEPDPTRYAHFLAEWLDQHAHANVAGAGGVIPYRKGESGGGGIAEKQDNASPPSRAFSAKSSSELQRIVEGPTSISQLRQKLGRAGMIDSTRITLVEASADDVPNVPGRIFFGWILQEGGNLVTDAKGRVIINLTEDALASLKSAVETVGHELHHIGEALAGAGESEIAAENAAKAYLEQFLQRLSQID